MIRTLRRAHGRIALALAVLVPAVFVASVLARKAWQPLAELPAPWSDADAARLDGLALQSFAAGSTFFVAREGERLLVSLHDDRAPSVLAYWTTARGPIDELPADAVLLGSVDRRVHRLRAPTGDGQLVLYSLGHGTVIGHGTPRTN